MPIIPLTPQDFRAIGERYSTADLVNEIDRLLPFGKRDSKPLTGLGFLPSDYTQLAAYRDNLSGLSAEQKISKANQMGATKVSRATIALGKSTVRLAASLAENLLSLRAIPKDETPEATEKIVTEVHEKIHALGGVIGTDSGKLRQRLGLVPVLFQDPALATASMELTAARDKLVADAASILAKLPAVAQAASSTRADAKEGTANVHETQGRAFWLLKRLAKTGRTFWSNQHNAAKAHDYQLNALRSDHAAESNDDTGGAGGGGATGGTGATGGVGATGASGPT
jgi:hypothetical protein